MFQADIAEIVRRRHQEVVVVVVMRAIELIGLLHQLAVDGQDVVRHVDVGGVVGDDVEMDGNLGARVEVEALEIDSGEQR